MTESRFTPDEFARLLSLPETHPERVRAEATAEFAAMKALLADFVRAPGPEAADEDVRSMRSELERRVRDSLDARIPAANGREGAPAPGLRAARGDRPGVLDFLRAPAGRWAVAFALVAVVAGIGWWARPGIQGERMRGVGMRSGFELHEARRAPGGLLLSWTPAPGADAYRVVFLDASLFPIARLEAGAATEVTVPDGTLQAELAAGAEASVEVEALRAGAVVRTTPVRRMRIP